MDQFSEYELGTVCSRLSSGKGISAKDIFSEGKYPVYGGNGLRGYTDTCNFEGDCAIIGRQGAFCGNVRYFSGKAYMTEHAVVCCANEYHNTRYLAYLLSTMNLGRLSVQSAQPGLSVKTLSKQLVRLPSLEQQNKVAAVLSTLDAKIAANEKINDNLAETLQAIYQHRYSTTNQSANYETLASICSYSKAKVAVSELTLASYYSTENMLPNKAGSVLAASLPPTEQTTRCVTGDVLVSNIRPYFKKIVYCSNDCGCSPDVLCFTPKKPALSAYLYCTLYADHFFDFMMVGSKGAKMPRGDKQQIMTYAVHMPTEQELREFNGIAMPALAQIESLRQENLRLSSLRDTLLPRLISGDIDVSSINL